MLFPGTVLLLLFLSGCATHAPMSEMVMFTPKKVLHPSEQYKDSVSTHYSKFSFAASVTPVTTDLNALQNYAESIGRTGEIIDYGDVPTIGLHSILLADQVDNFAASFTLLPAIGFDFTTRVYKLNYLTAGITAYGGFQVIAQRPLYDGRSYGSSLGIFYERTRSGMEDTCSGVCFAFEPVDTFTLQTAGVRFMLFSHNGEKNRSFLGVQGKLGYTYELRRPFFGIGFTLGQF